MTSPQAQGWWHGVEPIAGLALYRIGVGVLCCAAALWWLPHSTELFSSAGFHVGPAAGMAPPPPVARAACVLLAASAASLAAGLWTRWALGATLALWSWLYAIDWINEKANASITIVCLSILLFSRCGDVLSIDALRARRAGKPLPRAGWVFWQRLLAIEFAQIYFFAGAVKLLSQGWRDGSALSSALRSRWATELGVWVSGWLSDRVARPAGVLACVYELATGVCLFVPRLRPWAIGLGVIFHAGIQAVLDVGLLGAHFVLALVTLYPRPGSVERLLNRSRLSGWRQTTSP